MSELKEMNRRHYAEAEALRARCPHLEPNIRIWFDSSVVGCGSSSPSVQVVCRNCGRRKVIFRQGAVELNMKVEKTLVRQGFKDERLDGVIRYQWELDES